MELDLTGSSSSFWVVVSSVLGACQVNWELFGVTSQRINHWEVVVRFAEVCYPCSLSWSDSICIPADLCKDSVSAAISLGFTVKQDLLYFISWGTGMYLCLEEGEHYVLALPWLRAYGQSCSNGESCILLPGWQRSKVIRNLSKIC